MRRDPEAGLTLLEMLLALVVMGMIGAGLAAMFATGGQVAARTASLGEVAAQGAARLRLRERLEAMPEVAADRPLARLFAASATEIRFAATSPAEGETFWSVVNYAEAEGRLTSLDGTLAPGTPAETLLDGISGLTITFYGRKNAYAEALWHEDWQDALILPLLVKIETARTDGSPNPPLTIHPSALAGQLVISASSLVPPGWPSAP